LNTQTQLVSGFHSIKELIKYSYSLVIKIYISNVRNDKRVSEITKLCQKYKIICELVDPITLNNISGHNNHQGFIAEINSPVFPSEKEIDSKLKDLITSRVLILDSIQDPRNLGACLRSALAFEFDAVIINKDGSAPVNEYVFKTSVGAILNLNIFYVTNLTRTITYLKKNGFWVIGLDGKGDGSIFSEKFSSKTALVLGSEGSGIRKLVKENCDNLLKIPISNKIESLNISVAAGIVMYELRKQHIN